MQRKHGPLILSDSCPTLSQIKSLLMSKAMLPENVDDMDLRFFCKEMPNLSVGRMACPGTAAVRILAQSV